MQKVFYLFTWINISFYTKTNRIVTMHNNMFRNVSYFKLNIQSNSISERIVYTSTCTIYFYTHNQIRGDEISYSVLFLANSILCKWNVFMTPIRTHCLLCVFFLYARTHIRVHACERICVCVCVCVQVIDFLSFLLRLSQ